MAQAQTSTQALIAAAALLTAAQEPFKVGDVVVWKSDSLSNRTIPDVSRPAVVTSVFAAVSDANVSCGSPRAMEPLDIKLASFCADGDLLEFVYDSRRFRLAAQEEIDAWEAAQTKAAE